MDVTKEMLLHLTNDELDRLAAMEKAARIMDEQDGEDGD